MLYGNLAEEGCIVKTAGVDAAILRFTGPPASSKARRLGQAILGGSVKAGDVVLVRYEGPAEGRACEMLYPTNYLKSKGLGRSAPW